MNQQAPLTRFSSRADFYARYRPSYPQALYDYLRPRTGLSKGDLVADIGSGTGLLSRLFLENDHPVLGVEPNQLMRQAGEQFLAGYPQFTSLDGTAEALPLKDASAGLIVAGQAFHWFDAEAFKAEASRVLRPGGYVALAWNRRIDEDPFVAAYEALLNRCAIDYHKADPKHRMSDAKIAAFFAPAEVTKASFPNHLPYDWDALFGLAMSQSYVPLPDHPNHPAFLKGLKALFAEHRQGDQLSLALTTNLYLAPIHTNER